MQHKAVYLLFCQFTLHVSGVNHTPIIRSKQNCNDSLRYGHIFCATTSPELLAWRRWREVAAQKI